MKSKLNDWLQTIVIVIGIAGSVVAGIIHLNDRLTALEFRMASVESALWHRVDAVVKSQKDGKDDGRR